MKRIGLDAEVGDRFKANSRKVKFCIRGPLPQNEVFPSNFNDFEVVHHYLQVCSNSYLVYVIIITVRYIYVKLA